jgi:RNA polymerase sigma-70 factor (ECF subfamily)
MQDEEFERLYTENAQAVFAFLAYRTGDEALAEDLLADVFERALRSRRRFDPRRGRKRTWLYSIALNLLRDHHRRVAVEARATAQGAFMPSSTEDHESERVEARDEIGRALVVLSNEEREAVALRFGADLSLKEISRVTGVSESAAEGRLYRALRKLRSELER